MSKYNSLGNFLASDLPRQTLGFYLQRLRVEKQMSKKDLALKCGITASVLTKLEQGKIQFRESHFEKLGLALDFDETDLHHLKQVLVAQHLSDLVLMDWPEA